MRRHTGGHTGRHTALPYDRCPTDFELLNHSCPSLL